MKRDYLSCSKKIVGAGSAALPPKNPMIPYRITIIRNENGGAIFK